MKLWKKILLQAGIFTSVFALGGGIGFLTCYKKVAPNKQAQAEPEVEYHEETPAEKFMSNLSSSKALEGNLSLSVYGNKEETNNNTLKAFELKDDIHIDITDLQISIADLDHIKVQGDVNLKVSDFDLLIHCFFAPLPGNEIDSMDTLAYVPTFVKFLGLF